MSHDIDVAVSSPEAATRLREEFNELLARVNGDLMSYAMSPNDPISVEAAVVYAEQRVDYHFGILNPDPALASILPDIKRRLRAGIELQAQTART